jgi:nucleotide-binding universal stress UspA family protein
VFNYILIPSDGSQLSEEAVRRGIDLAKSVSARVTGFTAIPEYPRAAYTCWESPDSVNPERHRPHWQDHAKAVLRFVEDSGRTQGVPCDTVYESRTDLYLLISALLALPKHMGASPSLWPLMESPVWRRF